MDLDTLNKIESLVKAANAVQEFHPSAEPGHLYFVRHGDNLSMKVAAPANRKHVAAAIDTLVVKAAETPEDDGAEVWCDRSGIVLLLDRDRRDTVSFALTLSRQVEELCSLAQKNLAQKDLIFLLRTVFRDNLGPAGDLVPILRNLKFNATQEGHADLQHGKSSIGKSLTAEITGTKNLPEYVTLTVPVFAQAAVQQVRHTVTCALEPDAGTQTFRFVPLPGQIELAIGSGELQVKTLVEGGLAEQGGEHVKVFLGKP